MTMVTVLEVIVIVAASAAAIAMAVYALRDQRRWNRGD
jgi:hypothetical protein